jgi:hypothetical protein
MIDTIPDHNRMGKHNNASIWFSLYSCFLEKNDCPNSGNVYKTNLNSRDGGGGRGVALAI